MLCFSFAFVLNFRFWDAKKVRSGFKTPGLELKMVGGGRFGFG